MRIYCRGQKSRVFHWASLGGGSVSHFSNLNFARYKCIQIVNNQVDISLLRDVYSFTLLCFICAEFIRR